MVGGTGSSSSPSSGDSDVSGRLTSLSSSGDLEACRFLGVEGMNSGLKFSRATVVGLKEQFG